MSDSTGLHYVKLEHSASNIKAMEPNLGNAWSDTMYTFNANLSYLDISINYYTFANCINVNVVNGIHYSLESIYIFRFSVTQGCVHY